MIYDVPFFAVSLIQHYLVEKLYTTLTTLAISDCKWLADAI